MCALSCKARARKCCIEGGTRFGFARNFKLDRSSPCHSVRVFTPISCLFAQSSVLERPNICVVISNFLCNVIYCYALLLLIVGRSTNIIFLPVFLLLMLSLAALFFRSAVLTCGPETVGWSAGGGKSSGKGRRREAGCLDRGIFLQGDQILATVACCKNLSQHIQ